MKWGSMGLATPSGRDRIQRLAIFEALLSFAETSTQWLNRKTRLSHDTIRLLLKREETP